MLPFIADGRREQLIPVGLTSELGATLAVSLTFDVYPAHRPSHPQRHLGAWAAPFELSPGQHALRVRFAFPNARWEVNLRGRWAPLPPGQSWSGQPAAVTGDALYQLNVWVDATEPPADHVAHTLRQQVLHWRDLDEGNLRRLLDREWSGPERRRPLRDSSDPVVMGEIARATRAFAEDLAWEHAPAVLDVGCGEKPYWPYFWGRCRQYVGFDPVWSPVVDVQGGADSGLPFPDASFEVVLCHQVLEHVRDPFAMVREIHRVLKPRGAFFASAPFVWEVHDYPADYWRYSEQGLRALLSDFAEVRIQPCGNTPQALIQTTAAYLLRRRTPPGWLSRAGVRLLGAVAHGPASGSRDLLLPANHIALAHKGG
jgi:SAM-dependent methyltransferase